jgi:hypothetical protein
MMVISAGERTFKKTQSWVFAGLVAAHAVLFWLSIEWIRLPHVSVNPLNYWTVAFVIFWSIGVCILLCMQLRMLLREAFKIVAGADGLTIETIFGIRHQVPMRDILPLVRTRLINSRKGQLVGYLVIRWGKQFVTAAEDSLGLAEILTQLKRLGVAEDKTSR